MYGNQHLDDLRQMDIEAIDRNELVLIQNVKIDSDLPASLRMQRYLEQIKNPYCFLCDTVPVKIRFASDGSTLADLLSIHFSNLKNSVLRTVIQTIVK